MVAPLRSLSSRLSISILLLGAACASSGPEPEIAEASAAPAPTQSSPAASEGPPAPASVGSATAPATVTAEPAPAPLPPVPAPDLTERPVDPALDDVGALLVKKDFRGAKKLLDGRLAKLDEGRLDVKLVAHVFMARALLGLGDERGAKKHYGIVEEAWKDPRAALDHVAPSGTPDAEKTARTARALSAVGEAYFFAAESVRIAAEKEGPPAPPRSAETNAYTKFVAEKLSPWVSDRRKKIDEAERAYLRVVQLEPVAPPRWVVASGERVGHMWAAYAKAIRDLPMPKEWMKEGTLPNSDITYAELRAEYRKKLDEVVAPFDQRARSAYAICVNLSKKFRFEDDRSKACEAWLEKNK